MTESEWLACTNPKPMLAFLMGKASDRKLRLLAFASERRLWRLDSFDASVAVELHERFVEGDDNRKELRRVPSPQRRVRGRYHAHQMAKYALSAVTDRIADDSACKASTFAMGYVYFVTIEQSQRHGTHPADADKSLVSLAEAAKDAECREQAGLVQCIFGNPLRPGNIDPACFAWNDSTVVRLAQSIYGKRTFERMPELAEALEEAGCKDSSILDHCRKSGKHVRGCWVVDLILGKK